MIVALAGGVGSARFLRGLLDVVDPAEVTVIVNTGDDDWFHGLLVCPDLDSVTYALAGANNPETGWGLAGETFATLGALGRYGVDTWFGLGDKDFATHLYRSERLRSGATLADVTNEIATAWALDCRLIPMSNDRVATRITAAMESGQVELAMEEWFVRERCLPPVRSVRFDGAERARPAPGVIDAITRADTVIICPANPVLSIEPIMAIPGVRAALVAARGRVVAVSPLIAGAAVKGPADRLFADLGLEPSCVGVARMYREVCGSFVLDTADRLRVAAVAALVMRPTGAETLMIDARVAAALARETLAAVA